jgi:hypothetical protein
MRKLITAAIPVLFLLALAAAPLAQGKNVPKTPVPTAPSIDGAVYTSVDLNDPNYSNECKNGNPAVNCNQYTAKQFVFLNGGPTKNHLTPDGVYFFAVLAPSGQANPVDGNADNLSDDYDCYRNREFIVKNGEVASVLTDPTCVTNSNGFQASKAHRISSGPAGGPFVQLFPYADTPNPGGVYIMGVCFVSTNVNATAPIALADPTNVSPSLCKYDAFKVMVDTTPPGCRLFSTNSGNPKSVTVLIQDAGGGLEDVSYSGTNLAVDPLTGLYVKSPSPLTVGQTTPFYLIFTKDIQTQHATFHVDVTDVGGNTSSCDPVFGATRISRSATVHAGERIVLNKISGAQTKLSLTSLSAGTRAAIVSVNGRRFAMVSLRRTRIVNVDLAGALSTRKKNVVTVSALGPRGNLLLKISN